MTASADSRNASIANFWDAVTSRAQQDLLNILIKTDGPNLDIPHLRQLRQELPAWNAPMPSLDKHDQDSGYGDSVATALSSRSTPERTGCQSTKHKSMKSGYRTKATRPLTTFRNINAAGVLKGGLPQQPDLTGFLDDIMTQMATKLAFEAASETLREASRKPCNIPKRKSPYNTRAGKYCCTWNCGSKFEDRADWEEHELARQPQDVLVCAACLFAVPGEPPFTTISQLSLKQHLKYQHFEDVESEQRLAKRYVLTPSQIGLKSSFEPRCGWDGYRFKSWNDRLSHIATHFEASVSGRPDVATYNREWQDTQNTAFTGGQTESMDGLDRTTEASLSTCSADDSQAHLHKLQNCAYNCAQGSCTEPQVCTKLPDSSESANIDFDQAELANLISCVGCGYESLPITTEATSHTPSSSLEEESEDEDGYESDSTVASALSIDADPLEPQGISRRRLAQMCDQMTAEALSLAGLCNTPSVWGSAGTPNTTSSYAIDPHYTKSDSRSKRQRTQTSGNALVGSNDREAEGVQAQEAVNPKTAKVRPQMFACPFYKHDPGRYRNERSCCGPGWPDVRRVKGHLYRRHNCYPCPRCWLEFPNNDSRRTHLQSENPCIVVPRLGALTGFDDDQLKELKRKNGLPPGEIDRWRQVYRILFRITSEDDIPSPYYNELEQQPQKLSPDSADHEHFEQFIRNQAPQAIRQRVMARIEAALAPLMESVRVATMADIQTIWAEGARNWEGQGQNTPSVVATSSQSNTAGRLQIPEDMQQSAGWIPTPLPVSTAPQETTYTVTTSAPAAIATATTNATTTTTAASGLASDTLRRAVARVYAPVPDAAPESLPEVSRVLAANKPPQQISDSGYGTYCDPIILTEDNEMAHPFDDFVVWSSYDYAHDPSLNATIDELLDINQGHGSNAAIGAFDSRLGVSVNQQGQNDMGGLLMGAGDEQAGPATIGMNRTSEANHALRTERNENTLSRTLDKRKRPHSD